MATHSVDSTTSNANEVTLERIRGCYRDAPSSLVKEHVKLLEKRWRLAPSSVCPDPEAFSHSEQLGFDQLLDALPSDGITTHNSNATLTLADKAMERENARVVSMLFRAKALGITGWQEEEGGAGMTLHQRINRIMEEIECGFILIRQRLRHYERVSRPHTMPSVYISDPDMFKVNAELYAPGKIEELSPFQRALYVCLYEAHTRELRRYKGMCCLEHKINGHGTRAWIPQHDIPTLVYKLADKQLRHDMWKDLTSKGSGFRDVINHLTVCIDPQFPEVKKCRNMWSYRNGVFLGKALDPLTKEYTCKFLPYESNEFKKLDPTLASCKYFDTDFEDFSMMEDWFDIPTPHFAKILDYQRLPEDVQRWAYVLAGRLCFDVGDLDGWQIIPFYGGIARSGKSQALTSVFKQFYEAEDVRTLSNNIERKFGLASIYDGFMFISPECRETMALEQAEFQSMVSGEDVSIAVKHEKAKSIQWTTPGVMAGNEMPGWRDTGGSILRRLVTFNFVRQVKDADATLPQKLKCEVPIMLQKCVRAYLDYALHKYRGVGNIWDILPRYFLEVRQEIEEQVSPLDKYLNSSEVVIDPDARVPLSVFQDAFQFFAKNRCGERNIKFSAAYTRGPFNARGITVERTTMTWGAEGRLYEDEDFAVGVTVKEM